MGFLNSKDKGGNKWKGRLFIVIRVRVTFDLLDISNRVVGKVKNNL
jgi:hypothetical protein